MPPPPPEIFEICIANGAFWINFDHQLRAEILPIFSNIFYSFFVTYFSYRECVGLILYRRRDKGSPIEKGGSAPHLDPPLVDLPKQVLVLLRLYVVVMHFIQIPTFNKYCHLHVYFHEISTLHVHGHTPSPNLWICGDLEFHVIYKQTSDAPSNAGVQCIYACNVGISLTKTRKQLTIIMESWHSNIFYNYDTLAQQHKHLAVLGVWFQSMPLLLNTDWTKLLNLTVLVMGQKWK